MFFTPLWTPETVKINTVSHNSTVSFHWCIQWKHHHLDFHCLGRKTFLFSRELHNFSNHFDNETHSFAFLPVFCPPHHTRLFVPREMCLPQRSPATAGARMIFRALLSQSAFPISLNALWRRGLLHDMILRVDKWPSMSRARSHSWGRGRGWGDRQLGGKKMKGAHSLTDVLIKNS